MGAREGRAGGWQRELVIGGGGLAVVTRVASEGDRVWGLRVNCGEEGGEGWGAFRGLG